MSYDYIINNLKHNKKIIFKNTDFKKNKILKKYR